MLLFIPPLPWLRTTTSGAVSSRWRHVFSGWLPIPTKYKMLTRQKENWFPLLVPWWNHLLFASVTPPHSQVFLSGLEGVVMNSRFAWHNASSCPANVALEYYLKNSASTHEIRTDWQIKALEDLPRPRSWDVLQSFQVFREIQVFVSEKILKFREYSQNILVLG